MEYIQQILFIQPENCTRNGFCYYWLENGYIMGYIGAC